MNHPIAGLQPDRASLVGALYERADYQDRFAAEVPPGRYDNVDAVVTEWFTRQPAWLRLMSTNTLSRKGVDAAVARGGYEPDAAVGSWVVIDRNRDEIVFGDDMGFMQYRFSLRLLQGDVTTVEAATAVKYRWRRASGFYFALVRPVHRRFVRYMLARTVC